MIYRSLSLSLLPLSLLLCTSALAQGTHQWTQARFEDFEKGTPKGVTLRSDGHLEAGPELKAILTTPSTYVWSVAADGNGNAYLATGSPATVLKVAPDGKSTTIFETRDLAVQTIRIGADGAIYASTLPAGKVYRLKSAAAPSASTPLNDDTAQLIFDPARTDEKPKYIWDMAFDSGGRLYIASGGPAAIYRYDPKHPEARPELFFKSDEQHIRCLAFDNDGDLIAGSDGSGLIYRIDKSGKGYVLFEASRREITSIAIHPTGAIYLAAVGDKNRSNLPPLPVQGIATVTATITIVQPGSIQAFNGNSIVPDGSEIFEIPRNGPPRKLWANHDEIIYALKSTAHGLIASGGNRGHIFRIGEAGDYADIGHLEAAQGVAFADVADRNGSLFIGTSNTGKLYKLGMEAAPEGSYLSDVFDASVYARWGRIEVNEITAPHPSTFELFARSGNLENPERGWSDWFKMFPKQVASTPPAGRYIQWKATLRPGGSIGTVVVNYLPVNVVPVFDDVVVAVGARVTNPPSQPQPAPVNITFPSVQNNSVNFQQDAATQPLSAVKDRTAITARWNAHDDNGDELSFDLYYRGDGEQDWHLLKHNLSERYYSFDAALLPDGGYRIKVVASDSPSHDSADSLSAERESDRFIVDTTPPIITSLNATNSATNPATNSEEKLHVIFDATDTASSIAHAEYAVDAGRWQYVEPQGKLSDSMTEHYDFIADVVDERAPDEKKIEKKILSTGHLITVRVYDRHDNVTTAKSTTKSTTQSVAR